MLHLVGLDQVNVGQSQSCSACRARQWEQWVERTRFKVENRHEMRKELLQLERMRKELLQLERMGKESHL